MAESSDHADGDKTDPINNGASEAPPRAAEDPVRPAATFTQELA